MPATGPTDTPLVTAVMIFLNGEKFIAEAIDSILAQTYENWELILVDDGSTDGATAIAQGYTARFPHKIRYIEHPNHANRGMSASRNVGVAAGSGTYVSFLDADDIWLPERLEDFVEVATSFPDAGMIYGPTLYWYSWAKDRGEAPPVEGQEDFPGEVDLPTYELLPDPVVLRQFLITNGGCLPGICSLLVKRTAYEAIGGFEPSFRGLYEDQVFLSKMAASFPIVIIDEVLDYYRQHSESCCWRAVTSGEYDPLYHHPAKAKYLRWLRDYVRSHRLRDEVISAAIRQQLLPYQIPLYIPSGRLWRATKKTARQMLRTYVPASIRRVIWQTRKSMPNYREP